MARNDHWRRSLSVAAWLIAATACAGDDEAPPPTSTRDDAVTQGSPSGGDAAVVALVTTPLVCGSTVTKATCTGTLIGERAVLTAGHCVEEDATGVVELGTTVGAPGNVRRRIVKAQRHPKYQRDSSDFDVAILWLDAAVPVAPIALPAGPTTLASGDPLRVVGFGQTRSTSEPEGAKRAGTMKVSATADNTIAYAAAPSMSCQGDSGGPVFSTTGGVERWVGIVSAGDNDCRKSGVAVRVDAIIADFVAPALAAPPPTGTAGVDLSCTGQCATDLDCRPGLACRQARDGENRCALPGFEPGVLKEACKVDQDCDKGQSCVTTFDGCQCYDVCPGPPEPVVTGPDPKADASGRRPNTYELSGGCNAGPATRARTGSTITVALLALAVTGARRRRRSPRRSTSPASQP